MRLSLSDLVSLAEKHGFPDPALAAAIAMVESGGETTISNNTLGQRVLPPHTMAENSVGLWQINKVISSTCAWDDSASMWSCRPTEYSTWDLTDPDANAQAAFKISSSGTNWQPWSTAWEAPFRSGYLGARAPFRAYYRPLSGYEHLVPPSASPGPATLFAVGAAALAAAACYAALERWR